MLTAAHCVHMQDARGNWVDLDPKDISVMLGSNIIAAGKGEVIAVKGVFRHPDYVGTGFDFDIALLKLAPPPGCRIRLFRFQTQPLAMNWLSRGW